MLGNGVRGFLLLVTCFLLGCSREAAEPADGTVRVSEGVSFSLEDGERYHREAPETFEIPPLADRENLREGQIVKLMFNITVGGESGIERMWVVVDRKDSTGYVGSLDNQPYSTEEMRPGMKVRFRPKHVITIHSKRAGEAPFADPRTLPAAKPEPSAPRPGRPPG